LHQLRQREVQLREIRNLYGPMVHLYVDVQMIVAIPGCVDLVGPEPLQVRRQEPYPGAADAEIATELIEQCGHLVVGSGIIVIRNDAAVGGEVVGSRAAKVEAYPMEKLLIIG